MTILTRIQGGTGYASVGTGVDFAGWHWLCQCGHGGDLAGVALAAASASRGDLDG